MSSIALTTTASEPRGLAIQLSMEMEARERLARVLHRHVPFITINRLVETGELLKSDLLTDEE